MTDYISRNGAKLALAKMRSDYDFDYNAIVDKCINRLMQLPIYRQEQKVGKWIEEGYVGKWVEGNDNYHYICSECGHTDVHSKAVKVNYCWFCGAKMEGAENE